MKNLLPILLLLSTVAYAANMSTGGGRSKGASDADYVNVTYDEMSGGLVSTEFVASGVVVQSGTIGTKISVGTSGQGPLLNIQAKTRTGTPSTNVEGMFLTGDFGVYSGGIEINTTDNTAGLTLGYSGIGMKQSGGIMTLDAGGGFAASSSNKDFDMALGTGKLDITAGGLKVAGEILGTGIVLSGTALLGGGVVATEYNGTAIVMSGVSTIGTGIVNGRVGIRNSDPQSALHISTGNIVVDGTTGRMSIQSNFPAINSRFVVGDLTLGRQYLNIADGGSAINYTGAAYGWFNVGAYDASPPLIVYSNAAGSVQRLRVGATGETSLGATDATPDATLEIIDHNKAGNDYVLLVSSVDTTTNMMSVDKDGDMAIAKSLTIGSFTQAEIEASTPAPGMMKFCSDCTVSPVCVGTGIVLGDFVSAGSVTQKCD